MNFDRNGGQTDELLTTKFLKSRTRYFTYTKKNRACRDIRQALKIVELQIGYG